MPKSPLFHRSARLTPRSSFGAVRPLRLILILALLIVALPASAAPTDVDEWIGAVPEDHPEIALYRAHAAADAAARDWTIAAPEAPPAIAFYRALTAPDITNEAAVRSMKLDDLQLEAVALLTDRDIVSWDWASQTVKLRPGALERFIPKNPGLKGSPFVVTVRGKRLYLGAFWMSISSFAHFVPVIDTLPFDLIQPDGTRRRDVFTIRPPMMDTSLTTEPFNKNGMLLQALRELGKLKVSGEEDASSSATRPAAPPAIAFYRVLTSSTLSREDRGTSLTLDELAIDPTPLLTDKDIEWFDWTIQSMKLRPGVRQRFAPDGPNMKGTSFVVTVNGKRLYRGELWDLISSHIHLLPPREAARASWIRLDGNFGEVFVIHPPASDDDQPFNKNPLIYNTLGLLGRLKHAESGVEPIRMGRPAQETAIRNKLAQETIDRMSQKDQATPSAHAR